MAQWSHGDRTLFAKLVYYGPAFGGKTTNLETLHRITDPNREQQLLTLATVHDRTLFFDLLPFDLGDILGYQVAVKIYTVPGQVRYDTTRQVVLAGTDAVVFVADSCSERKDQNVWSLQNLKMNMRAKGLDPSKIPVLYQFNKQDLPGAAPVKDVAGWLGIRAGDGVAAVATEGRGVLETFMIACKAMLERLVAAADERTRRAIDVVELGRQLERTFAPHLARRAAGAGPGGDAETEPAPTHPPVALEGDQLLERSVETSVRLGEKLTTANARVGRLEREAEALRSLSETLRTVGASFDPSAITDAVLRAVQETLDTPVVSLLRETSPGSIECVSVRGCEADPLVAQEAAQSLLVRLLTTAEPCLVVDPSEFLLEQDGAEAGRDWRAVAAAPISWDGERAVLLAYEPQPDGSFSQQDIRFLVTVAGHLAVGLEKARLHADLQGHRDRLEAVVERRTTELRRAYASLQHMEQTKDRFLGNVSHEMKTPLTAILSAAHVIRDFKSNAKERKELVEAIISSAELLEARLEELFRVVNARGERQPVTLSEGDPEQLIEHAIQLAGHSGVQYTLADLGGPAMFDMGSLGRALANLIDNAVKFSPPSSLIRVISAPARLNRDGRVEEAMAISVVDRGQGVAAEDRERIFAPFEQGGDPLASKPRGVGLGLHEARIAAGLHGGVLEFVPRDGKGSEFRLTVPLLSRSEQSSNHSVEMASEVTRA